MHSNCELHNNWVQSSKRGECKRINKSGETKEVEPLPDLLTLTKFHNIDNSSESWLPEVLPFVN